LGRIRRGSLHGDVSVMQANSVALRATEDRGAWQSISDGRRRGSARRYGAVGMSDRFNEAVEETIAGPRASGIRTVWKRAGVCLPREGSTRQYVGDRACYQRAQTFCPPRAARPAGRGRKMVRAVKPRRPRGRMRGDEHDGSKALPRQALERFARTGLLGSDGAT